VTARKRWLLLFCYLALLAASHGWRALQKPKPLPDSVRVVRLAAVDGTGPKTGNEIDLAYRLWEARAEATARPTVVMLHGSPGSSRDFLDLAPAIATERPVLAPDLPGFGASERRVPDYSIRAHAGYTVQLIDELGLDPVDLVGFSMGGGVALEIVRLAPERVRSLTLLSSIGVQELELLGNYESNHALHGLQLAGLWALHEAFPHFGALDDSMLSVEYCRNFYDTDQRPLRGILEAIEVPVLILHGDEDPLVPLAAAEEHYRIAPHSQLAVFEGDHFMIFFRGDELAGPLDAFLQAVDDGTAVRQAEASADRLEAAARPYDPSGRQPAAGFSLFVVMLLLAAATLISEDLACIGAGLLVAHGPLGFGPAVVACLVGIVAGDIGLYWSGRLVGARALKYAPLRWILSQEKVAESAAWLEKRGIFVILTTRFVPGTRLPTYFTAGMLKAGFWKFTGFFLVASLLWTPFLVGLASAVGNKAFEYFELFRQRALLGLVVVVLVVWLLVRIVPSLATSRGRRLAYGRWRRLTHWEYWPWWIVYLPVTAWVLLLGLRHRSLSLFTLANPGMPAGGFVGESKGDLLEQMPAESVPRWLRLRADLEPDERIQRVETFLASPKIALPLVLKPDSGERGFGVLVATAWDEIEAYLESTGRETLVQECVEGLEYGVFYARLPAQPLGEVTSVARKILPTVTGDGESNLEQLILGDDRAVCYAHMFFARFADSLDSVPAVDETVRLGDLGTHSRGATFLDANHLITPELTGAIDRIARGIDGFFLGRFDLRAPSERHLQRGEELKILELNGVTSEEAHMYDPKHGLLYAWRTLIRQWARTFEIAAANRRAGHSPGGTRAILREIHRYQARKRIA
jgi:pimeloyl-ACP methyl ester carboxylesterase/membrane protein DedA with SNARE-associated domain